MANPGSARSPERLAPSHRRSSEVISGHQRSSAVIRGHQRSSEVGEITREIGALHQPTHGREDDPEHVGEVTLGAPALRRADTPLGPRGLRQTVLCPFGKRGKKSSSVAVRGHQRSSAVISGTHLAIGPARERDTVEARHGTVRGPVGSESVVVSTCMPRGSSPRDSPRTRRKGTKPQTGCPSERQPSAKARALLRCPRGRRRGSPACQ
jgi:hypothetical protein